MLPITEDIKGLDMTFEPSEREVAMLASALKQEWFNLIQKFMEQEVKLLNIRLINTATSNPNEILANHAIAKGAGMFYVGFIQRMQQLLTEARYQSAGIGTADNPEQPPYPTEFSADPSDEVS